MSNDDSAVQVVVRVRPLNRKEVQEGCEDCSNTTTTSIRLQAAGTNFNFDRVFDPRVSQAEIYEASAKGIVQKCFNGYNGTIFAYGQTGSGKTFSMGTDFTTSAPAGSSKGGDGDLPKTSGIIPRAVHEIFHTMQTNEDVDFKLTVSYLEVYKEEIKVCCTLLVCFSLSPLQWPAYIRWLLHAVMGVGSSQTWKTTPHP